LKSNYSVKITGEFLMKKVIGSILLFFVLHATSEPLVHKRLFSGLGVDYCFLFSQVPTGNVVRVATTMAGSSFTSYSDEEIKTADGLFGINVDVLEYYFSKKVSLTLTSFNGWAGTSNFKHIRGLTHSENTFFNTMAFIPNYNILIEQSANSVNGYVYCGIGPVLNYIAYARASATLDNGTEQEVTTTYNPGSGMVLQFGYKSVQNTNQLNIGARFGFSFGDISINNQVVKQYGVQVPSSSIRQSPTSPIYLMFFVNYDYGWL
jgi:hypothetical protein